MLQWLGILHSQRRVRLGHPTRSEELGSVFHGEVRENLGPYPSGIASWVPTSCWSRFEAPIFLCIQNALRSRRAWLSNFLSRESSGGPRGLPTFPDFKSSTK